MVQTGDSTASAPQKFGEHLRITVAANQVAAKFKFQNFFCNFQGGRRYMEDRCVIHTERSDNGTLLWTFVGVFDGHGGEHASEYVRNRLLKNITVG